MKTTCTITITRISHLIRDGDGLFTYPLDRCTREPRIPATIIK